MRQKADWKKVWVTVKVNDPSDFEGISFDFTTTKKLAKNMTDPVLEPKPEAATATA